VCVCAARCGESGTIDPATATTTATVKVKGLRRRYRLADVEVEVVGRGRRLGLIVVGEMGLGRCITRAVESAF
jgi:hypothetical protein